MTDTVSPKVRSAIMSRIKGKNTKPELTVRSFLHRSGLRFRVHRGDLPGAPDLVFPKYRTVIFVNGCFWHQHRGCVHSGIPLSNRYYWGPKLRRTVKRDRNRRRELRSMGWFVDVVWECQISEVRLIRLLKRIKTRAKR